MMKNTYFSKKEKQKCSDAPCEYNDLRKDGGRIAANTERRISAAEQADVHTMPKLHDLLGRSAIGTEFAEHDNPDDCEKAG